MREMINSQIEWIGSFPKEWSLKPLQYCLSEINEKNKPIKTEQVLSLVKDKGVMLYEEKGNKGNKAKENLTDYKVAYPNTLIVNSMNILIGSVGISKYLGCVSPVYYVFTETDECDLRYINYIFNTREFQRELRKYANGILEIRMRVSSYDIFKRKIPLPKKEEQKRIADYLDRKCGEIDSIISNIQEEIERLNDYKYSIITEAVTKGLATGMEMKYSGNSWIGDIPSHWKVKRLKYLSSSISKGNGITKEEVFEDGDTPCIRYGEIYSKYDLSFQECFSRTNKSIITSPQFVSKGDILFAGTGELIEEIGKNIVYQGEEECLAGGDIIVLKHKLNPSFLNYALRSVCAQAQKSSGRAKLKVVHISAFDIGNIRIAYPSDPYEQEAIANYLDDKCKVISSMISLKNEEIELLEQYKKSAIFEYVTGKKEVTA